MKVQLVRKGIVDQTTGFLLPKWQEKVKVKGFRCSCGLIPARDDYSTLLKTFTSACRGCGSLYDLEKILVEPEEGSETYEIFKNPELARERVWFHATRVEDWVEKLPSIPLVHVGTHHAAIDRALTTRSSRQQLPPVFLHEVKIKSAAKISSTIYDDHDQDVFELEGNQVGAYVNRWEGMGQISLVAQPEVIEVVNTTILTPSDLLRFVTIYNVP